MIYKYNSNSFIKIDNHVYIQRFIHQFIFFIILFVIIFNIDIKAVNSNICNICKSYVCFFNGDTCKNKLLNNIRDFLSKNLFIYCICIIIFLIVFLANYKNNIKMMHYLYNSNVEYIRYYINKNYSLLNKSIHTSNQVKQNIINSIFYHIELINFFIMLFLVLCYCIYIYKDEFSVFYQVFILLFKLFINVLLSNVKLQKKLHIPSFVISIVRIYMSISPFISIQFIKHVISNNFIINIYGLLSPTQSLYYFSVSYIYLSRIYNRSICINIENVNIHVNEKYIGNILIDTNSNITITTPFLNVTTNNTYYISKNNEGLETFLLKLVNRYYHNDNFFINNIKYSFIHESVWSNVLLIDNDFQILSNKNRTVYEYIYQHTHNDNILEIHQKLRMSIQLNDICNWNLLMSQHQVELILLLILCTNSFINIIPEFIYKNIVHKNELKKLLHNNNKINIIIE